MNRLPDESPEFPPSAIANILRLLRDNPPVKVRRTFASGLRVTIEPPPESGEDSPDKS